MFTQRTAAPENRGPARSATPAGVSAGEILTLVGMSARPESYAGAGALEDDGHASSRNLLKLFRRIRKEHGEDAAQNFAKMISDTPVLSGFAVVTNLYALEVDGWCWQGAAPDYSSAEKHSGLGGLAAATNSEGSSCNALGQDNAQASAAIRCRFLDLIQCEESGAWIPLMHRRFSLVRVYEERAIDREFVLRNATAEQVSQYLRLHCGPDANLRTPEEIMHSAAIFVPQQEEWRPGKGEVRISNNPAIGLRRTL